MWRAPSRAALTHLHCPLHHFWHPQQRPATEGCFWQHGPVNFTYTRVMSLPSPVSWRWVFRGCNHHLSPAIIDRPWLLLVAIKWTDHPSFISVSAPVTRIREFRGCQHHLSLAVANLVRIALCVLNHCFWVQSINCSSIFSEQLFISHIYSSLVAIAVIEQYYESIQRLDPVICIAWWLRHRRI